MAYTPGPWVYELGTKTIRSKPENYWLASMNSFDGAVNHHANARLIAAAPELLEALEAMLADVNSNDKAREKARASIARAKGVE